MKQDPTQVMLHASDIWGKKYNF